MNTLGELLAEKSTATEPQRVTSIREAAVSAAASRGNSVHDEQIQALVQQLFFRQDPAPVRHVGFAAVEPQTDTAQLCLDVALALAETGSHDIGLIDARLQSVPLHTQLQIPAGNRADTSWQIAPRLWLAPRRSWLDDRPQRIWDPSLAQLRTITMEFDFTVLCFDPVSWLTAKLSQTCGGLVMVLTANKTRRLVAAQMQEQFRRARVPLLGTVLAERRFPVPPGLYRNL
jgi:Mrp family chromosome partitioning ATPase